MYEMNIEGEYRRESALRMLVHVEHDTLFSEMPKEMKPRDLTDVTTEVKRFKHQISFLVSR